MAAAPNLGRGGYIYTGNEVLHWREFNRTTWASVINIRALLKAASLVSQLLKDVQKKKSLFPSKDEDGASEAAHAVGRIWYAKAFVGVLIIYYFTAQFSAASSFSYVFFNQKP